MIRPEILAALTRWREVIASAAVIAVGLWIGSAPGPVLTMFGAIIIAFGAAAAFASYRRARFRLEIDAPGLVEIDEGQISYLSPAMGGSVELSQLSEIQVLVVAGNRRCWRLKQSDGQTLLVPLAAAGADALVDSFASLPGLDGSKLQTALATTSVEPVTLWRLTSAVTSVST